MMVLVSYDVRIDNLSGKKRLRRISKLCSNWGQRVQYSVFECLIEPAQWVLLKQELVSSINQEKDSLRFYYLGNNWKRRFEHVGAKEVLDPEGTLIF